jgi:hypothetical protein
MIESKNYVITMLNDFYVNHEPWFVLKELTQDNRDIFSDHSQLTALVSNRVASHLFSTPKSGRIECLTASAFH